MNPELIAVLASAITIAAQHGLHEQGSQYDRRARLAEDGTIFVSSDSGKSIKMADHDHCLEVIGAEDQQTIGCSVAEESANSERHMQSRRLEIYMKNGRRSVIQTAGPIAYWHFWDGGRAVAATFQVGNKAKHHALYESSTGTLLQEIDDPTDLSQLPQWAKNPAQIQDESVAEGEEYDRARTAWIAKTMRRIATIKPGMRRDDLTRVFRTEGGLSTRSQRTYVLAECPYIKVTVQFKPGGNEQGGQTESPDDVIESISRPYLAWSVMD